MRRMGKTGMTQRCFLDKRINDSYYTFFVDIYAIKSLRDFVYSLSREHPSSKPKPSAIRRSATPMPVGTGYKTALLPASTAATILPCRD